MGKPTGFMDYNREDAEAFSVKERIQNYNEFHTPLSKKDQEKQGARCMECGVPFCQAGMQIGNAFSGCPLNNLIPEWNDLIFKGCWEQAYNRLKITNNFPEFTSRVCPALCEKACTCGANGEAVTVRANEYGIIENAYEQGLAEANPPKVRTGKKLQSSAQVLRDLPQLTSSIREVTLLLYSSVPTVQAVCLCTVFRI